MDPDDLFFEPGFQWSGCFVKHATYRGRPLAFRLSPQLVANCLDPVPGDRGRLPPGDAPPQPRPADHRPAARGFRAGRLSAA
jgi:hypothetical protein